MKDQNFDRLVVGGAAGAGCLFVLYYLAIVAIVVGAAVLIWQHVA